MVNKESRRPGKSSSGRSRAGVAVLGLIVLAAFVVGVGVGWWTSRRYPPPPPPIPVDLPAGRYLAIGDSYSAGEGLDPWEEGTQDSPSGNRCHRSAVWAYSRLLTFVNETEPMRRACSGAVIENVYEIPQVHKGAPELQEVQVTSAIQEHGDDVSLVTLTMSGNDIGFSKVLTFCFKQRDCMDRRYVDLAGKEFESLRLWAETRLPNVSADLVSLFQDLRTDFPRARILALGYPHLFPVEEPPIAEDPGGICHALFGAWDSLERAAIREWGSQLNAVIAEATRAAGEDIEFVDLASYFAGHEACGSQGAWLRAVGITSGPVRDGSFHPRRPGQAMIARIVSCHLSIYDSASEVVSADDESRFAMAGCVAGQSVGLGEVPAGTLPGQI